jgi:hypothetical protein
MLLTKQVKTRMTNENHIEHIEKKLQKKDSLTCSVVRNLSCMIFDLDEMSIQKS